MKTRIITSLLFLSVCHIAFTQQRIHGVVEDRTGAVIPAAQISVLNSNVQVNSDAKGKFEINQLPASDSTYTIMVEKPGFLPQSLTISAQSMDEVKVLLFTGMKTLEDIHVNTTRLSDFNTSQILIRRINPLERKNFGQDIPILLEATPSLLTTSDAGAGVGYTGLRIRGVDATRINVTINGIPVNDPESHAVYWVNMPDLASSIENIQIQRGVGSSSNGAAAFGASVNIKTQDISEKPFGSIDQSFGSFGTSKTTIKAGTGIINKHFSLETRMSSIQSNGFLDRASSDLKSYFLSGAYIGNKSVLKAIIYSGKEITYQAWYGTPESRITGDSTAMNAYADRNGLSSEERENLLNSGRTYNYYTYENQVDHYQQDNYQLHFTHTFNDKLILNLAGHYTYGRGYYEQYRKGENLADYGLNPVMIGSDTIQQTDLIRRLWLENDYIGAVYGITYKPTTHLDFVWGGSANTYFGGHFGELVWAQYASNSEIYQRYYNNDSRKTEASSYLKAVYKRDRFDVYTDLQFRHVDYAFIGKELVNGFPADVTQDVQFNFFNPKVGGSFKINTQQMIFMNYGISHREPVRADFVQSTAQNRPTFETLRDLEFGHQVNANRLTFTTNLYYMNYKNQLLLTGAINDVGAYIHTNVAKSHRLGIEVYGGYRFDQKLKLTGGLTLSQNKVAQFNESVDVYLDTLPYYTQQVISHNNTDMSFSPNVIGNVGIEWMPLENLQISWMTKYVARQYLDNTGNVQRSIDPYNFSNLQINYSIFDKFCKEIQLGLMVNNAFNQLYENNGYTFSYVYGGQTTTENFYYPQAGRNFMARVLLKF
ncbi:MAG: TonB-dependent receptor [Crocinitomicaceae bacterium]|jgi:iron complex outermembrane recepter protein|nr:TonB-dependent receptor [Crocinitomicaceae bacterium]MDP4761794.1 TonB-dependent receptor [Crocinitomicaceae bacterium]